MKEHINGIISYQLVIIKLLIEANWNEIIIKISAFLMYVLVCCWKSCKENKNSKMHGILKTWNKTFALSSLNLTSSYTLSYHLADGWSKLAVVIAILLIITHLKQFQQIFLKDAEMPMLHEIMKMNNIGGIWEQKKN